MTKDYIYDSIIEKITPMETEKFYLTTKEKDAVLKGLSPFDTQTFKNAYYAMTYLGGLSNLECEGDSTDIHFIVSYVSNDVIKSLPLPEDVKKVLSETLSLDFVETSLEMTKKVFKKYYETKKKT